MKRQLSDLKLFNSLGVQSCCSHILAACVCVSVTSLAAAAGPSETHLYVLENFCVLDSVSVSWDNWLTQSKVGIRVCIHPDFESVYNSIQIWDKKGIHPY